MATGRPQKGLNSNRNHHDSFGQSGQQRFGGSPSTLPKTTISSVLNPKSSTPKADAPKSLTNRRTQEPRTARLRSSASEFEKTPPWQCNLLGRSTHPTTINP